MTATFEKSRLGREMVLQKVAQVIAKAIPILKGALREFAFASDNECRENDLRVLQLGFKKIEREIAKIQNFAEYFQPIKNPISMIEWGEKDTPIIEKAIAYCDELLYVFKANTK